MKKPFENILVAMMHPSFVENKRSPSSVPSRVAAPSHIANWTVAILHSIEYVWCPVPLAVLCEIVCHPCNQNSNPEMPNSKCSISPFPIIQRLMDILPKKIIRVITGTRTNDFLYSGKSGNEICRRDVRSVYYYTYLHCLAQFQVKCNDAYAVNPFR